MSESRSSKATTDQGKPEFRVKKLSGQFVDEVANISISPNGACRLQFCTWATDEQNQPVRVDSELIMTMNTLNTLADALPKAIEQAKNAMSSKHESSKPETLN